MNSPNLPEKNESFTPLSLDRLMKLKEEIFEEVLRVEDKSKQWLYISYIWLGSLDDARELCCNLEDPIERFFFDIVECTDCLRVKYSDILEPLFGERYNKIPKNYMVHGIKFTHMKQEIGMEKISSDHSKTKSTSTTLSLSRGKSSVAPN